MKFSTYLLFIVFWATFVYFPVCHWVWGQGGWLGEMGALDLAGGTVIHINSCAAALVACLMLGKRKGHGRDAMHPHSLPLTVLGAASSIVLTFVILKLIDLTNGLRVGIDDETQGLDVTSHGEVGYSI